MQVGEAVQSQTLNVETHLQLERCCLDQCLRKQPAVLLSCDSTRMHKHRHIRALWGRTLAQHASVNAVQETSPIFSPLTSLEQRVVTQATMSSCRFIELRPPRLDQVLRLYAAPVLLVSWLNQDDLETVELLDEGQRFLELSLALGNLQETLQ